MPLNERNTKTFHRTLYAGILQSVTLLKRGDNQQQGTVKSYRLHQCRMSRIQKTNNTIDGDMLARHRTIWHIPRSELDRIGIAYLNPLDRIVDKKGRYWHVEADTAIDEKLFENHVDLECWRVDPP